MKKVILSGLLVCTTALFAQQKVESIQNNGNHLLVNDSILINRGNVIKIHLPAGKDFVFIRRKKSVLGAKMLGSIADVVGVGASAIGIGSNNIGTITKAIEVANAARAVEYGVDALEKIQELPISDNAKKIAGKKMKVLDWTFTDDGWIIIAEYERKKYEIYLQGAVMAGEIKF